MGAEPRWEQGPIDRAIIDVGKVRLLSCCRKRTLRFCSCQVGQKKRKKHFPFSCRFSFWNGCDIRWCETSPKGDPLQTFQSHRVIPPRVWESGPVDDATCEHKNPGDLYFSEGKREEGSHPCAMSDALSLLYDSLAIWLFFFSSSSHHSPPFCRLADWIPVMDGSWRASASHAPFQLRRLPLTVTGHSTYPCAQLTFFLSLYLSLPYFFFPFRRNGSERERRRRKNLWAISSSRPLERVIRLSLIFGYFFFFLTSPRSLNTARRHSRYFSLSLSSIYLYDYASIQSRSAKTRECASGIRENPDFSRSLDLIALLFSYLPVCPLIRHTRPWMGIQRNAS